MKSICDRAQSGVDRRNVNIVFLSLDTIGIISDGSDLQSQFDKATEIASDGGMLFAATDDYVS